jgi:hypothetical protein
MFEALTVGWNASDTILSRRDLLFKGFAHFISVLYRTDAPLLAVEKRYKSDTNGRFWLN